MVPGASWPDGASSCGGRASGRLASTGDAASGAPTAGLPVDPQDTTPTSSARRSGRTNDRSLQMKIRPKIALTTGSRAESITVHRTRIRRRRLAAASLALFSLGPFVASACKLPPDPIILDAAPPPPQTAAADPAATPTAAPSPTPTDRLSPEACADTLDRLSRSYAAALGTVSRSCASVADCTEVLSPCNYAATVVAKSGLDTFLRETRSVGDECGALRRKSCFLPPPAPSRHEVRCVSGACTSAPL